MSEENFLRSYKQIFTAIDHCIAQNLSMPALILIYSAIDSISWVADQEDRRVGKRFQAWVDEWMLQRHPLPCTSLELYAARCGILHTLTPDADLNERNNVRRIAYAWGTAEQKHLEMSIRLVKDSGLVGIHINDLQNSFRNGFADYLNSLKTDKAKKDLFSQKAGKHYANMEISLLKEFLKTYSNEDD